MFTENGFSNPLWFVGIVEDNVDPLNQGRVRVRCFGLHPPYATGELPTSDLPWAAPINGSYGGTAQIPRVTDWVVGFFPDGRDAQHPFIFGTLPGQNLMAMSGSGVLNASAYMKPSDEARRYYGKVPLPPSQGGENLETTQLVIQDAMLKLGVPIASDGKPPALEKLMGWTEPSSAVSSNPAQTTLFKSSYSDSYVEVCGQEGNEFINVSHSSGSQVQIDQFGTIKIKSLQDRYDVTEGKTKEWSGGRKDVYVDGTYTIKVVNGDCTLEVDGDLNHVVHGDYNLNVAGRMAATIGGSCEVGAARISMESVAEHINLFSKHEMRLQSQEEFSVNSKTFMVNGGTQIGLNANRIDFNTPIEEIPEGVLPALAMQTQVNPPTELKLAIDSNQSGLRTTAKMATALIGNPNSPSGTASEDTDLPSSVSTFGSIKSSVSNLIKNPIKKISGLLSNGVAKVDQLVNRLSPKLPFSLPKYGGLFSGAQGVASELIGRLGLSGSGGGGGFEGGTGGNPGPVKINGIALSYRRRTNGNRPTYNFSQRANQLPKNSKLSWYDGKTYTIPNPTKRYEYNIGPFLWKPRSDADGNVVLLGKASD